jgi:signal transduction histidine kinase
MRAEARSLSTAEQLAQHVGRLARKTEALDDLAALVAHDVRAALIIALRGDDPRQGLRHALELLDSVLEVARVDPAASGVAPVSESVRRAIADLGEMDAEIVGGVTGTFPMPPAALRLVLRNLLANAAAAGASHIHVSALGRGNRRALVIDDDGVGIDSADGYASGAQLGLRLCRRLVERCGCVLELRPRALGGTRALIVAGAPV